jgi:preprotein translocase subunit YajC
MNNTDSILVLAQAQPQQGGGSFLLMMALFMGAMYFLMIAPQRKKQKEHQKMVDALAAGDEILTSGGLYATVVSIKEDRLIVRVADNTRVELSKQFVTAKISTQK